MRRIKPVKGELQTAKQFLVIDAGNTTTHFGVCNETRILKHFRLPSIASTLVREAPRALKTGRLGSVPLSGALVASVVPKLNSPLRKICLQLRVEADWLSHKTPIDLRLLYRKPKEIGADRIANIIAARENYGCPSIVVDVGTAITFDCISKGGAYLGGIIAPGPKLSRAALAIRTGLLPFVDIKTPRQLIGKSTAHAIQAGMIFGARELIKGIVQQLRVEMGGRPKVIFTGGQLELIVRGWRYPKLLDALLTLNGLRIIYNKVTSS